MVINIKITDKRPSVEGAPVIVCGNSDYTIKFTFDAEWDAYSTKTVRFVWVANGKVRFMDVNMKDTTECKVPKLHSTNSVRIGVYAGDLHTTTRAVIPCEWSILCEGGKPATEDYQYYANEAMDAANEAKDAAAAAARAKKFAEEAEARASDNATAASTAANQAASLSGSARTAATNAASAASAATAAKTAAEAAAAAAEAAASTVGRNGGALFSNTLKGKKSGGAVAMSDISPLEHTLGVRVRSKNLIPYPYVSTSGTRSGVTFTDNGDGSITVKGTATSTVSFNFSNSNIFEVGKTYLLGAGVLVAYKDASGTSKWAGGASSNVTSLTWKNGYTIVMIYYQVSANKSVDETIYPFIVEDTDTPEYTPYIPNISAVKVKKLGKNLIPFPYVDGTSKTHNGVTFTVNEDGSITVNGTPTGSSYFILQKGYNYGKNIGGTGADSATNGTYSIGKYMFYNTNSCILSLNMVQGKTYNNEVFYPQLEFGTVATEYEPPIEPIEYAVNEDGTVEGVLPIYPTTTLLTDTAGAVINVEYNRDINKAFAELYNAIISLGGNV